MGPMRFLLSSQQHNSTVFNNSGCLSPDTLPSWACSCPCFQSDSYALEHRSIQALLQARLSVLKQGCTELCRTPAKGWHSSSTDQIPGTSLPVSTAPHGQLFLQHSPRGAGWAVCSWLIPPGTLYLQPIQPITHNSYGGGGEGVFCFKSFALDHTRNAQIQPKEEEIICMLYHPCFASPP